jgi:hypothetical protein
MIITSENELAKRITEAHKWPKVYAERMANWIIEVEELNYGEEWPEQLVSKEYLDAVWARLFGGMTLVISLDGQRNTWKDFRNLNREVVELAKAGITVGEWRSLSPCNAKDRTNTLLHVARADLFRGEERVGLIQLAGKNDDSLWHLIENIDEREQP